jgi:antitoxin HigA-1
LRFATLRPKTLAAATLPRPRECVLPKTINEICREKRGISAEMAWKLSQSLGAGPNFWLNLQNNWELSQVKVKPIKKLALRAA